jgi:predicted PurR-regulated permease PerM
MPEPSLLPTKRWLIFVGALAATLVALVVLRGIVWPLLVALAIAYLLDPVVSRLERHGVPRTLSVIAAGLGFFALLGAFAIFVVPAVWTQLGRLTERLPDYWTAVARGLGPWIARITGQLPAEAQDLPHTLIRALQEHIPQVASSAGTVAGRLVTNLLDLVLLLLSLVFVLVFSFYLLRDFPNLRAAAFELVPVPYREVTRARLAEVDGVVAGFVRGQLTIAAINGTIFSVGLTLLGVPMALVLGLAAGLGNLVPYLSIVVGLIPALLLCWVEQQSLLRLLAVLGLFLAVQAQEDVVLRPRILGKHVNLHPVWILLAIIAGGELFGVMGMLLAVPVAGVVQVFLGHWLEAYKNSRIYRGGRTSADGLPAAGAPTPGVVTDTSVRRAA